MVVAITKYIHYTDTNTKLPRAIMLVPERILFVCTIQYQKDYIKIAN